MRVIRNRPPDYEKKPLFPYKRRTMKIQCFPLYSILAAMGNPKVDYFSLDVEGAEFSLVPALQPWLKVQKPAFYLSTHVPFLNESEKSAATQSLADSLAFYKNCTLDGVDHDVSEALLSKRVSEQFPSILFEP